MELFGGSLVFLKRHNQAKIIRKAVFLFWLLYMAIRYELYKEEEFSKCGSTFNFGLLWQRIKYAESHIYQLFSYFFGHACPKLDFVLIPRLTGKCATRNLKKLRNSIVYGHVGMLSGYGHIKEPK